MSPVTPTVVRGGLLDRGLVRAQVVEQVDRRLGVRAALRGDQDLGSGAGLVHADDLHVGHVGLGGGPGHDVVVRRTAVGRDSVATVDDEEQRRFAAGSERVADQVGGLALRGVRRRGGVARQGEVQPRDRDRERAETDDHQHRHGDRRLAEHARPADAAVEDLAVGVAGDVVAADRAPEGLRLQHAEDRREQREGHEHRHEHRAGCGQAHAGQERDAHDRQCRQGNQHRQPGEDHRRPGRPDRDVRPLPRGRRCGAARCGSGTG